MARAAAWFLLALLGVTMLVGCSDGSTGEGPAQKVDKSAKKDK